jgi:hypothetical protein
MKRTLQPPNRWLLQSRYQLPLPLMAAPLLSPPPSALLLPLPPPHPLNPKIDTNSTNMQIPAISFFFIVSSP